MQSFGSVQERRLRAHRTEQARGVARDVFGLAHAGQMNAAAARLGGANHVDRGANLVEVDLAAQRPKLAQAQFHEAADLDRGVERTARLRQRLHRRQRLIGHRFAKEREHFVARLEA